MNMIPRIALAGLTLVATVLSAPAQGKGKDVDPFDVADSLPGPEDPRPKMLRVQVEFVDVAHSTLTALLSDEKLDSDTKIRNKITELIKNDEARILETQIAVANPGQKATTESIEEYIYPTEYEPAELPNEINVTLEGKEKIGRDLATGPTPTAFETRNLGSTLEIEPALSHDHKIVELRFAPEIVKHVRNEPWATWKNERGKSDITMPVMFTMRVSTGVTVEVGAYRLAAALSPMGKDGYPDFDRKAMVFVKCDVIPVGATPAKKP